MTRSIQVYPYGPDIQRHFEEMVAAGSSESEARGASSSLTVEWPADLRLPVVGDGFSLDWVAGHVRSASFHHEDGRWYFTIHVGPR